MAGLHIAAGVTLAMAATGAAGGDKGQSAVFRALLDCRGLSDSAARLACYDGKVATIAQAEQAGDVVIADRAQVRQARRQMFGFSGLRIPFLSGDDSDAPTQIEASLSGLRDLGHGRWRFTLDNGMTWRQTDDEEFYPKVGDKVVVKAAAMGSYLLKIRNRAVRVMREE